MTDDPETIGNREEALDPKTHIPELADALGLSSDVVGKANKLIDAAAENDLLSGKSPTGHAAGAVYAASLLCNEKVTQKEVAEVADVSELTIRNRYQEQIYSHPDLLPHRDQK